MEPNIPRYFVLIANTVSVIIIWMLANVFFGLYLRFAIVDDKLKAGNIIYYVLALATFIWLLRHIIRKWNRFARE